MQIATIYRVWTIEEALDMQVTVGMRSNVVSSLVNDIRASFLCERFRGSLCTDTFAITVLEALKRFPHFLGEVTSTNLSIFKRREENSKRLQSKLGQEIRGLGAAVLLLL